MSLAALVAALLLAGNTASAQGMFPLTFRGTCSQTDSSGKITSTRISDRDWLQEVAARGGVTDLSTLQIVYHVNGNGLGDTIDVINPQTGSVLTTIFGFYFSQEYGRKALMNQNGDRRIQYVYTEQNSRSLGTALVSKNYLPDRTGTTNTTISGQMTYLVTPDASNPNLKLCNGTFTVGKELFFNKQ